MFSTGNTYPETTEFVLAEVGVLREPIGDVVARITVLYKHFSSVTRQLIQEKM